MTTTTSVTPRIAQDRRTATDVLLTASLFVAPIVYLAADSMYAARGWADPAAGVVHVFGAIAYAFVFLRVASWLPRASVLRAVVLLVGMIGVAGNVAYGFDTIHTSLGDKPLVDQSGAAILIKPLGLFFPLALLLAVVALAQLRQRWQAAMVLAAAVVWPVAHIGNFAPLAVAGNVALVVGLGGLAWSGQSRRLTAHAD